MTITFLGTGTSQGIPLINCDCEVCHSKDPKNKRLRSAVHLDIDGLSLVIDVGPDFRQQMLRANIRQLDAILLTHEHADHTAGLDDIRPFYFNQKESIPILAEGPVIEQIITRFSYFFSERKYPGSPKVEMLELVAGRPFHFKSISIIPLRIWHGELGILAYRFDSFAYITDAKRIDKEVKSQLENCEVLVVNALRHKDHPTHFQMEEALDFISEVKPKQAFITHMSHQIGLHEEIQKTMPKDVFLAYDGLKVIL